MGIQIIYIGRQNKNLYSESEKEFIKRIKRYSRLDIIEIKPLKKASSLPKEELLKSETKLILDKVNQNTALVLLDEAGKQFDSRGFAKELQILLNHHSSISFVIGGAFGFSDELKSKSHKRVSLSSMTFPHHLARVIFLEQLYRAYSILNNEPYHND